VRPGEPLGHDDLVLRSNLEFPPGDKMLRLRLTLVMTDETVRHDLGRARVCGKRRNW
jgi:hypothetical protein